MKPIIKYGVRNSRGEFILGFGSPYHKDRVSLTTSPEQAVHSMVDTVRGAEGKRSQWMNRSEDHGDPEVVEFVITEIRPLSKEVDDGPTAGS